MAHYSAQCILCQPVWDECTVLARDNGAITRIVRVTVFISAADNAANHRSVPFDRATFFFLGVQLLPFLPLNRFYYFLVLFKKW